MSSTSPHLRHLEITEVIVKKSHVLEPLSLHGQSLSNLMTDHSDLAEESLQLLRLTRYGLDVRLQLVGWEDFADLN